MPAPARRSGPLGPRGWAEAACAQGRGGEGERGGRSGRGGGGERRPRAQGSRAGRSERTRGSRSAALRGERSALGAPSPACRGPLGRRRRAGRGAPGRAGSSGAGLRLHGDRTRGAGVRTFGRRGERCPEPPRAPGLSGEGVRTCQPGNPQTQRATPQGRSLGARALRPFPGSEATPKSRAHCL